MRPSIWDRSSEPRYHDERVITSWIIIMIKMTVDQSGNVVDQNVHQVEEISALERAHASSHDLVN